jgi:hypothetical protein
MLTNTIETLYKVNITDGTVVQRNFGGFSIDSMFMSQGLLYVYMKGTQNRNYFLSILDPNNIITTIREPFLFSNDSIACKVVVGDQLFYGSESVGSLYQADMKIGRNTTATQIDEPKSFKVCKTATYSDRNSQYVYFVVDSILLRLERWNMLGGNTVSFSQLQWPFEMQESYISFVDPVNDLLFVISASGSTKIVDISEYYDPKIFWIGGASILAVLLVLLAMGMLCCFINYRRVRGQKRVEEELRGLLNDSMGSYQSSSDTPMNLWVIPPKDLKIVKNIASGSFGQVFVGKYKETTVAIKKLKVDDDEMFHKEVGFLVTLRHPNIVLFIGVCGNGDYQLIVTEYLENGSLDKFLRLTVNHRHTAFPFVKKMEILMDIIKGMQYLHSMGLIHRDVKSQNILVRLYHAILMYIIA